MYRSATWKLTAWYLVLVMAISLAFSGVVYHFAGNELAAGLRQQTRRIYQEYPVLNGDPFFVRNSDASVARHHILLNLAYFNIAVLVLAGVASYWLARRTLAPIEASNERQRRFVADASHELRTPVAALRMDAEVALMDAQVSPRQLRDALKSTVEEAEKLDTLLNSLLRLSQLDSGEVRQTFTVLPIRELADAATRQVAPQAEAREIQLDNTVGDAMVEGSRDNLTQLLVILLDNAIKYSPQKSTVAIWSEQVPHAVTIAVKDNGIGIEPDALGHVFDRFYRADKARSGHQGFGLGLSIAQQIAGIHHGSITLSSTVGKGTKASLTLPTAAVGHEPLQPGKPER